MRKIILTIFVVLILSSVAQAVEVNFGGFFGIRTVNDSVIKEIYGNGMVVCPALSLSLKNGFGIGVSYELYNRSGTVKPYNELTRLKINGPEIFLSYAPSLGIVRPYVHAGYGFYSYKQTIESEYLAGYAVNDKASGFLFAGGVGLKIVKPIYVFLEAKYVSLKVRPIEDEVDLGGWRFGGGIGISFGM